MVRLAQNQDTMVASAVEGEVAMEVAAVGEEGEVGAEVGEEVEVGVGDRRRTKVKSICVMIPHVAVARPPSILGLAFTNFRAPGREILTL